MYAGSFETPRGSYKDILMTPRGGVPSHLSALATSRGISSVSPLSRFSKDSTPPYQGSSSSMSSSRQRRTPVNTQVKRDLDRTGSMASATRNRRESEQVLNQEGSRYICKLAETISKLEENDLGLEGVSRDVLNLYTSRTVQHAARLIGVPAGVLDLLQLHEKQRIIPRISSLDAAKIEEIERQIVSTPSSSKDDTPRESDFGGQQQLNDNIKSRLDAMNAKMKALELVLS